VVPLESRVRGRREGRSPANGTGNMEVSGAVGKFGILFDPTPTFFNPTSNHRKACDGRNRRLPNIVLPHSKL